ncbi:MAG: thiamine phosphate synthase, partial [Pseudomonadota bacterium]
MNTQSPQTHCRLVLVTPPLDVENLPTARLTQALRGGDVASLILPQYQMDEATYETLLAQWTPIAQEKNVAVISSGELRFAKRQGLDGIHMVAGASEVRQFVEGQMDAMIVGATAGLTRHAALEMGEARPDYVLFGKFGGDTHANVHPKLAELAQWWAQMVE